MSAEQLIDSKPLKKNVEPAKDTKPTDANR